MQDREQNIIETNRSWRKLKEHDGSLSAGSCQNLPLASTGFRGLPLTMYLQDAGAGDEISWRKVPEASRSVRQ
jgi:hypothetical protein